MQYYNEDKFISYLTVKLLAAGAIAISRNHCCKSAFSNKKRFQETLASARSYLQHDIYNTQIVIKEQDRSAWSRNFVPRPSYAILFV